MLQISLHLLPLREELADTAVLCDCKFILLLALSINKEKDNKR